MEPFQILTSTGTSGTIRDNTGTCPAGIADRDRDGTPPFKGVSVCPACPASPAPSRSREGIGGRTYFRGSQKAGRNRMAPARGSIQRRYARCSANCQRPGLERSCDQVAAEHRSTNSAATFHFWQATPVSGRPRADHLFFPKLDGSNFQASIHKSREYRAPRAMIADRFLFSGRVIRIGWNKTEAAERLNVSVKTIQRWWRGDTPVPAETLAWLRRVADAIDTCGPAPGASDEADDQQ